MAMLRTTAFFISEPGIDTTFDNSGLDLSRGDSPPSA